MSRFLKYVWPGTDIAAVCASQTLAGAGNLTLNGTLSSAGQVSFINHGFIRQISITSTANISARTITINGLQNGAIVTENITGPNNTTVYGTLSYDVITSISINGAAANISVGTGLSGLFPAIGINLETTGYDVTYSFGLTVFTPQSNIEIGVYATLDDIINNGTSFRGMILAEPYTFSISQISAETDQPLYQLGLGQNLWSTYLINVVGSATNPADTATLIFRQV